MLVGSRVAAAIPRRCSPMSSGAPPPRMMAPAGVASSISSPRVMTARSPACSRALLSAPWQGGCVFEFVVFHDGLVVVWVIASQSRRSLADSSPPDQAIMASNAPHPCCLWSPLTGPSPCGWLSRSARLARSRLLCKRLTEDLRERWRDVAVA